MIQKLKKLNTKNILIVFICYLFIHAYGKHLKAQAVIGARELAMGQATTALQETSWSMFANPAMMSQENPNAAFFGVRYFGFSEVTDMAVSVTYPTEFGVIGAGAHRYGFDLFNENRLRLGYKNELMGFHYGVILNYSHVAQDINNGSAGALGVDVGVAAPITSDLWLGAKATNVNQPAYGSRNNEKLPRDLSIGLSYYLSDIALFSADVYKDVQFPISYRAGVEMAIIGGLKGRVGVTTSPQTFTAGIGYVMSSWSANIAVQRHENQVLGYSPALDFKISW
ncbi:hypothetical protein [Fodinibius halophilus]|uniref:PorV/PorQ family protein n=1 Tax=Fodinibius halophilus TaxID=1736908 RepID=A0A6M1T550_9BACT|nr:hypothetical protein [Fodinibius halophilus]NGP87803.1 hypothetical protein [Fodinibius halophilus]